MNDCGVSSTVIRDYSGQRWGSGKGGESRQPGVWTRTRPAGRRGSVLVTDGTLPGGGGFVPLRTRHKNGEGLRLLPGGWVLP